MSTSIDGMERVGLLAAKLLEQLEADEVPEGISNLRVNTVGLVVEVEADDEDSEHGATRDPSPPRKEPMPDFAKHVEIFRAAGGYSLRIDGQEFPWYVREAISTSVRQGEIPVVQLALMADEVSIRDQAPQPEQSTTTDSGEIAEWFNGEDGGDSRDPFMVELLAYLRDRDELTEKQKGIVEDFARSYPAQPAEDSADESLPDLLERIQRILPNLEALVAKLKTPRPKAEDGRRDEFERRLRFVERCIDPTDFWGW